MVDRHHRRDPVIYGNLAMVAFGNNQFADLHRILGTHRSATLKFSSGIHCLQDLYQAAYSCCCSDSGVALKRRCRQTSLHIRHGRDQARHRRVPRSGRCSNCETASDDARRPPAFRTRTPECPRRASATFALKGGVWFRRGRLLIVSPDSLGHSVPAVRQKLHLSSRSDS